MYRYVQCLIQHTQPHKLLRTEPDGPLPTYTSLTSPPSCA